MNVMMLSIPVWSGNVSDMIPEQRDFFHWLSALIALAGGGLFGPAVLPLGAAGACAARTHQHGRADQRSASCLALAMSVVETINHAEHAYFDAALMLLDLPAGRPLSRPEHAPARRGRWPEISRRLKARELRRNSSAPMKSRSADCRRAGPATSFCCVRASAPPSTAP